MLTSTYRQLDDQKYGTREEKDSNHGSQSRLRFCDLFKKYFKASPHLFFPDIPHYHQGTFHSHPPQPPIKMVQTRHQAAVVAALALDRQKVQVRIPHRRQPTPPRPDSRVERAPEDLPGPLTPSTKTGATPLEASNALTHIFSLLPLLIRLYAPAHMSTDACLQVLSALQNTLAHYINKTWPPRTYSMRLEAEVIAHVLGEVQRTSLSSGSDGPGYVALADAAAWGVQLLETGRADRTAEGVFHEGVLAFLEGELGMWDGFSFGGEDFEYLERIWGVLFGREDEVGLGGGSGDMEDSEEETGWIEMQGVVGWENVKVEDVEASVEADVKMESAELDVKMEGVEVDVKMESDIKMESDERLGDHDVKVEIKLEDE
ncbi:hypothetical protein P153DRAFT_380762 [Dothidotthia symphoricarpi CBS 119687]|uniref:Uncharacterized protein n=1 Tax=Dothidotthia symphoricarpi CBS 119687 TaxID=1392245 RepID=A0A6A6AUR8_9PLEO|nr:uncharacterized protein P153DRAFT_380762 [Dothidotthia symphoricarpi CBS 119687]KAF2134953.1 hypothetical protein P153DRAFT_380762 [Dothidotthia symphoricarpi CBS 119687]